MLINRGYNFIISLMRLLKVRINTRIKFSSILRVRLEKNIRFRCENSGEMNIGEKVFICENSILDVFGGSLEIKKNTFLNSNVRIVCMEKISIGENSMLGPGVMIYDHDHAFQDSLKLIKNQGYVCNEIDIAEDVWIGANAIITKGVKIGKHSVIGANSVVTKNIPEYSVAVGNPARVIKTIKVDIGKEK